MTNRGPQNGAKMLRTLLIIGFAAVALSQETLYPLTTVSIGSVGITHIDLKGALTPDITKSGVRSIIFRTSDSGATEDSGDLLDFRCSILDESFITKTGARAMFCRGDAYERDGVMERIVFTFTTEGLQVTPQETEIELRLERDLVNSLVTLPGTIIGTTILGDHV